MHMLGLCFPHQGTTASRHSWHSCTVWRFRSASSLSLLFWYTDGGAVWYTPDSSAVPQWGILPVICSQGSSVSPLCFDIIGCVRRTSFNHRRSSFSGRCCPLNVMPASSVSVFRQIFKTMALHSFFPRISCSACALLCHFRHYNRSFLLTFSHLF